MSDGKGAKRFLDWLSGRTEDGGMSESAFVERKVLSFRRRYPATQGWFVCRVANMKGVEYLPALLRQRNLKLRENWWVCVNYDDGLRSERINLRKAPFVTRGAGLCDDAWFGTIRFTWQRSPIIIERHSLEPIGLARQEVTLVASKDRSAVESLGEALQEFWRRVTGADSDGEVYVHNGGGTIRLPKLGWDDLIVPARMGAEIRSNVEAFFSARATYRKLGLPFRRGFLFVGPPGGGKTTAAKIIMANAKAKPVALSLQGEVKDSTIEGAFREASHRSPAVLLVEDLDKLVSSKDVSMSYLLNLLDGLDTYEGFLLIATSNEPEKIDNALLHRPSRFDRVWHFGFPGVEERKRLLTVRGQGKFSDRAIAEVADGTAGFSMAYVQEVAVSAVLAALHAGREPADGDLLESLKRLREQYRASTSATGALSRVDKVGFSPDGSGGERGED